MEEKRENQTVIWIAGERNATKLPIANEIEEIGLPIAGEKEEEELSVGGEEEEEELLIDSIGYKGEGEGPNAAVGIDAAEKQEVPRRRGLCCRELELQEFLDKFVIRSLDPDAPGHAFSVLLEGGDVQPLNEESTSETPLKISTIYGVAGVIRLLSGTYLLVITSRQEVGSYLGFPVYCVKSMRSLYCNKALKHLTPQEKRDEAYFMSLLRTLESTHGLYYSYEVDLTLNLQRACKLTSERIYRPLWKQADPRFIWNQSLLEDFIENKLDSFAIPLIQGSFQTLDLEVKSSTIKVTLLSRRCNRRLGTRMWRRGANLDGAVANFIETEQLLEFQDYRCSYIQVRGSIPLIWEQIVDLSYKPRLNVIKHDETPKVVERHFHDLIQRYGSIVAIDLTDKHGDEGQLSSAFAAEMEKLPYVRYVSFDFHHVCGKGNFDSVHLLYDQISEDIKRQRFFLINDKGEILMEQTGIVRANCIDCLDRTNVTQNYLARKSLDSQLQWLGVFTANEYISTFADICEKFQILWGDHGDELSLEYAGTHALKGDLVRYGRQTFQGMIKDGMSAVSRYYLNNFQDGIRQDALDLISGRYTIRSSYSSPLQLTGFESPSYLPVASALVVGGLTITTFTINQAGRNAQHFLSSVLWASVTAGFLALVKANGRQFCSRPRLCGLV